MMIMMTRRLVGRVPRRLYDKETEDKLVGKLQVPRKKSSERKKKEKKEKKTPKN